LKIFYFIYVKDNILQRYALVSMKDRNRIQKTDRYSVRKIQFVVVVRRAKRYLCNKETTRVAP